MDSNEGKEQSKQEVSNTFSPTEETNLQREAFPTSVKESQAHISQAVENEEIVPIVALKPDEHTIIKESVITPNLESGSTSSIKKNDEKQLTEEIKSNNDNFSPSINQEKDSSKRNEFKREYNTDGIEIFDGLTRRQLLNLFVLALTDFVTAILITNQNPWYPIQSVSQYGISLGLIGLVFGSFELACFLFLPLFLGYIHKCCISPQTLLHLGVFTVGASSIVLSFLAYFDNWIIFLSFSILLRFIEGIGQAASISASFVILAVEFPNAVSSAFMSLETFYGLGLIIGPVLGGTLWKAIDGPERFTLVFSTFGGILFIVAIIGLLMLPQHPNDYKCQLDRIGFSKGFRLFALFQVSSIPLIGFTIFSTSLSIGFLYVTLASLLFEFNLHPVLLGGIFLINGGSAAFLAPIIAKLIDCTHRTKLTIIIGSFLIFIGFSLLGPSPFLNIQRTPWLISIGLFVQGIGIAAICAASFKFMIVKAIKSGYANNIRTYYLVSSLWTLVFCFGLLIGTITSGFIIDYFQFNNGSWFVLIFQILAMILTLISLISDGIIKHQANPRRSGTAYTTIDTESEPLLGHGNRGLGKTRFGDYHERSDPRKRLLSEPSARKYYGTPLNESEDD